MANKMFGKANHRAIARNNMTEKELKEVMVNLNLTPEDLRAIRNNDIEANTCSVKQTWSCSHCTAANPVGQKYCSTCGRVHTC